MLIQCFSAVICAWSNTDKLEAHDKEIRTLEKKLAKIKDAAEKLLNLALEKVTPRGVTYTEKMERYERETAVLADVHHRTHR